ncbi:MAG: response regulator transcription factor [Clostridia bacterium]|nr:response regulator transcription factor [Clostridia bacterium]MBR3144777.1 response regulator transcription factor [Clostridia bacterium]
MKKLLVVEDEDAIREFEAINLRRAGYEVTEAASAEEALDIVSVGDMPFDVALLDVMMPGMDGFALCKELRAKSEVIGIIMLTAKSQEMDKVSGLMIGADDYITKPFSPSELIARVDSLYRRVELQKKRGVEDTNILRRGDFVLDFRKRELTKRGQRIELTQVEFQIVEYFFLNPDTALSRRDILEKIWGGASYAEEKIVDVNMRRLRIKMEDDPSDPKHIVTVWGLGYKWSD